MSRKRWLYLIVALVCVVGLLASGCVKPEGPAEPGEEEEGEVKYVSYKVPFTGETVRFEKGAWVEGMKSGEEDLYIGWKVSNWHNHWMVEEIWRRTKGHWKLSTYYSGVLAGASEEPYLIGAGAYEMGQYQITYFPTEFSLSTLTTLPFWSPDNPAQAININHYCCNHPFVQQNCARLNLCNMSLAGGTSQYTMQLRKGVKEINRQADFEGLVIRTFGYWYYFAEANGMIPVSLRSVEAYEGLWKGMIDVNIASASSVRKMHFYEVCDYIIKSGIGSAAAMQAANMDRYNELPQYLKDIWWEVIPLEHERAVAEAEAKLAEVWDFLEEQGMTVYTLPEEEWSKVQAMAYTAYEQWLEDAAMCETEKRVREYARDCEIYREKVTGEPNPVGFVF